MSIGTITVDLLAKTGSFETDLNRSAKLAEKRAKEIDASISAAGTAIGAGLAVIGASAVAMASTAIDQLAELDDAAQKTGSSVESLSKIQQTALTFNQDFGEVDSAITRLARGMAEVESETNKTQKALEAIGLSSRDLSGNLRDPSELFTEIAKKLQDYEDGASKAALVTDLFGKSGAELLPFLNDLAENVDNVTGVSAEAASAAATFQDNLGKLQSQVSTLTRSIVGDMLPALNGLATALANVQKSSITGWLFSSADDTKDPGKRLKEIRSQLDSIAKQKAELDPGKGIANRLNEAIFGDVADLTRQETLLRKQEAYLKTVQQTQALALGGGTDQIDRMANPPRGLLDYESGKEKKDKKAKKEKQTEAEQYLETLEKQLITTQDLTVAEEALAMIQAGKLGKVTADQQAQILAAATLVDMTKDQLEQEKARQKLVEDGKKLYEETRTPIERLNVEYARLNELLEKGVIDWDTYARATLAAQDAFDKLNEKVQEAKGEMDIFAENAAKNIQDAFADFLFDPFSGGLKGMVKGFADAVRRMAADAAAADLARMLFGKTSGGEGKGIFGSLFSAGVGLVSSYFGGGAAPYSEADQAGLDDLIKGLEGRATGGPVSAGTPYIVGERGQELFVPNTSGTIIPNHALGVSQGRDVQITQHIVVDSRSDQASVVQAMVTAKNAAIAEIKQEMRNGGEMARLAGRAS